MNIYEKMAGITAELSTVAKNLRVGEGKSSYKAVGEADVLAAVKPLESKFKIYSYPVSRKVIDSDIITTSKVYNGAETTTSKFFMRVETVYRFVNTENPEEYLDITTYGDGVDANDKAPGKAMTYGDKYALLKAYKIITGDDPDQQYSEESTVTKNSYKVERTAEPTILCDGCKKSIHSVVKRDGELWGVQDIVGYSTRRFGRKLCPDCQRTALKTEEKAQK